MFPRFVFERSRQANSKLRGTKRKAELARYAYSAWYHHMDRQLSEWKSGVERLWAAAPDYRQAAQLAAEIARGAEDAALRQAAAQALPSLRNACANKADQGAKDLAWRRFSLVRDALHTLTLPRFGKRGHVSASLTPQQHYRQMLGLPFGRRLAGSEIHQAYKRAAKTMHPDGGGNSREFQELSKARDALMKER
jgi:hypothetical protein